MPVTARLSKLFYERLGEQVAGELVDWFNQVDATYRNDLRELNELNFARFDAKLEQRLAQLEAKFEMRFAQLEAKIDRGSPCAPSCWARSPSSTRSSNAAWASRPVGWSGSG